MLPTSDENKAGGDSATGTVTGQGVDVASRQGALVQGDAGRAVAAQAPRNRPIAPRPEILYSTPTAIDLIRALQRRWLLALITGVVFATCAIIYVALTTGVSTKSSAIVTIKTRKPTLMYATSEKAFAGGYRNYIAIQTSLIKRKFVLNAVMKQPGILELPEFAGLTDPRHIRNQLAGMYRPSMDMKTERMFITAHSSRPETCAFVANTVKRVYLTEVVEAEKQLKLQEFQELQRRYETDRQQFLKKQAKLHELERQYNGDVSGVAMMAEKERAAAGLAEIKEKASKLSLEVHRLTLHIELLKQRRDGGEFPVDEVKQDGQQASRPLPGQVLEDVLNRDPLLAQWKSDLANIDQLIASEKAKARDPNHAPSIRRVADRAKALRTQIQERTAELQLQIWRELQNRPPPEEQLTAIEQLERKKKILEHDVAFYIAEYKKRAGDVRRIKEYSDDLEIRRGESQFIQSGVVKMRGELQRREYEMQAKPRIEDLEDADVPLPPSTVARNKKMRVAGLGGFCLALIGVALYEFMARRITSPIEMSEGLGIRVMGNIPLLSERTWRHRFGMRHESERTLEYLAGESMDSIRETMLRGETQGLSVVMVASAVRGEGKSTVAHQFATSVARTGRRTLLVDGDLRSPSAHVLMDLPSENGLSELLSGQCDLAQAIQTTETEGLWLLAAGSATSDGLRELARGGLQPIFETLREEFDFIVVDTPPTLEVPDALAIGNFVDAAIVSVVYRVSQISRVYETIERLQAAGIDVHGCVVNGRSSGRIGKYDYGYDYGYGYGYGYGNGSNGQSEPAEK